MTLFGVWTEYKLENIVTLFDVYDYECYFEGQGRLWRLTKSWDKLYEFYWVANVLCVRRNDMWYDVIQRFVMTVKNLPIKT